MQRVSTILVFGLVLLLAGCAGITPAPETSRTASVRPDPGRGLDITLYALGLIDTGYRYGGKNPDAGLDCSGMVSHIYSQAAGLKLGGSAADIARAGRPINRNEMRPGDLVFFNTRNAPFSHVGIYIGDDRFVHAPSTNGRVRIDDLNARYYAQRFEAARAYFD